jgi:hypothetical protein
MRSPLLMLVMMAVVVLVTASNATGQGLSGREQLVLRWLCSSGTGKCVHVQGASQANGATISQWKFLRRRNLLWEKVDIGGGYFFLKAAHSGKCAQVDGASRANGARISQWDCLDQDNVKWRQELAPGNYASPVFFVVNKASGKCMHVHGFSHDDGALITQWDCIDQQNVQWYWVAACIYYGPLSPKCKEYPWP